MITEPTTGCTAESTPIVIVSLADGNIGEAGISVYPNPAVSFIDVLFNDINNPAKEIVIFNFIGEKVSSIIPDDAKVRIDLPVASGIYTVKIITDKGTYATKVIKQ